MRKLLKLLFSRIGIVSVLILLQLVLLFMAAIQFTEYFVFYYLLSMVPFWWWRPSRSSTASFSPGNSP